jgi:hypothetical protein
LEKPNFYLVVRMKKLLLIIITLHLSIIEAVAATDLYSGEVPVNSQSEPDRKEAIPEALIQVLQKLSGQRELPASPALDEALNNAERLLLSFRYVNVVKTSPDDTVSPEIRLVAQFIPPEVDRIIQQAGLPRWRQERPEIQIWVVIDDGLNRVLKPIEFGYAWDSLEDIASMRGLPVGWPELDEEEAQLIDMRLLWGGFTDYLIERGAPVDGVLIIAARREGPEWTLRWNLSSNGQIWNWRNSDQELMFALAEGVHAMTDRIAAFNTIAASDQGVMMVDVTIGELNNSRDYLSCLEYLQNLSLVTAVDILGAAPGRVQFRLQLNASSEYLADSFNRGTVLMRASAGSEYDYEFLH